MLRFRFLYIALNLVLISGLATLTLPTVWGQTDLGIPSSELPEALEGMDIRDGYVPAGSFARAGTVHALQGTLVVVHRADQTAFAASQGDPIHENDELFTLTDSRCRIRFLSEDVVNIAPETRFSVERFLDRPEQGEKTSLFGLLKGKAMFYALRLFRYRDARFQVETPTAVVGVRGTQFGMHVFELEGEQARTRGVRVADQGTGLPLHLAQADPGGPGFGTIVACGDGELDVKDRDTGRRIALVRPNEDFNTVTGQKTFDPQNRTLNGIAADTRVQEEREGGAAGGQTETQAQPQEEEPQVTGEGTASTAPADVTDLTTDVTTQQRGERTAQEIQEHPSRPSRHFGYFGAVLRAADGGYNNYTDGGTDFDKSEIDMIGGDIVLDGSNGVNNLVLESFECGPHGQSIDYGESLKLELNELGHTSYMEWGSWTVPESFVHAGVDHSWDLKSFYVWGENTPASVISSLSSKNIKASYSGDAFGTFWDGTASDDMSGNFACQVNFGSSTISDFDLYVSGDTHEAKISGAVGNIVSSDGGFNLQSSDGGVWEKGQKGQMSGDSGGARGSFYGPNADEMGGNWHIGAEATGIFAGKKQ